MKNFTKELQNSILKLLNGQFFSHRLVYEHYEQKLEKLLKNDSKNKSKKEQEMLDKNKGEYQKAAPEEHELQILFTLNGPRWINTIKNKLYAI